MKSRGFAVSVLIAATLAVSISACSALPGVLGAPHQRKEHIVSAEPTEAAQLPDSGQQAKIDTQAMTLEVLAQLTPDLVTDVDQRPHGALLSCADEKYVWSGVTRAAFTDAFSVEKVRERLTAWTTSTAGYALDSLVKANGTVRLTVMTPDGARYNVNMIEDAAEINVIGYSPCIPLGPGESVFDEY